MGPGDHDIGQHNLGDVTTSERSTNDDGQWPVFLAWCVFFIIRNEGHFPTGVDLGIDLESDGSRHCCYPGANTTGEFPGFEV